MHAVLIVLGFMSLILTVTQRSIIKICIPNKVANRMLPCHRALTKTTKAVQERILAASSGGSDHCGKKGMTSLISQEGLNQLSIFIFVLAVMQIVYSVLTMALGRAKMKRWKAWESETQTIEYQAANDPNRFRYTRQTTFGRRHMNSFTRNSLLLWMKCFFRQFFNSVAKVDYLTLRRGFIAAHLSNNNLFNFQKYIQRSLDDDFREVVGISPFMWLLVVIFMLVDVHGYHVYLWVSFLPLIIVLVLGTKLEIVVAKMALEIRDQNSVIKGAPLVQPNDKLFWFGHPEFVLTLLHFTLFINAFEIAFFIWVTLQFGIKSCYHENTWITVIRVVLAVTVQVMCSYITLPLYALVTQMGSQYKSAILEEETSKLIRQWHAGVRKKKNKENVSPNNLSPPSSPPITSSRTMGSSDIYSTTHSRTDHSQLGFSSHHNRTPTFGEPIITSSSGQNEIEVVEEEGQESGPIITSSSVQSTEIQVYTDHA
ncbi:RNA binding protein Mlo3 [Turnera subulata]|uniref:MLO-like protein n=1 Tax=Turnera subulata TaxID=218843 RepID=A0A9Q0FEF6_9ROSI|nr:RNA binding protein Mlo3 [Turnera subulata]